MRRSVAILLALAFGWMLIPPAFAGSPDSKLPLCCRKNGKHHCMMRMNGSSTSDPSFAAVGETCPYFPYSTAATHVEIFTPAISQANFAGIASHRAVSAQTEAGYRASHLRSKQKRGPPSSLLS